MIRNLTVLSLVLSLIVGSSASPASASPPARPPDQEEVPPPTSPIKFPPGTFVMALLGLDKRPTRNFRNTDVIMIAAINPDIPSVTLLSIPRDTMVYIPGVGTAKVNTAYGNGGFRLFKQTIQYNFGITIDNVAMVNFEGFVRAVETVGGIDVIAVCPIKHGFPRDPYYMGGAVVAQDYRDTFTGEVWKAGTKVPILILDIPKPGIYSLKGLDALAFVRARKGIPGGDVDRGRREQRAVRALFAKIKDANIVPKIPQLLTQMQSYVQTDLPLPRILQLAGMIDRFSDLNIRSRFLDSGDANGAADGSTPQVSFWANRHEYLQQLFNVAINQRPNNGIPVEVVNGTNDPGFAIAAADRLRELGFRVLSIEPAEQPYRESVIFDYTTTTKGSAVPLLTRTFDINPNNVVKDPRKDGARYRVVVGSDFNTCYFAKSLQDAGSDDIPVFDNPENTDAPLPSSIDFVAPLTPTLAPARPTLAPTVAPTPAPLPTSTPEPPKPTSTPPPLPTPAPTQAPAVALQVGPNDLVNIRSGPSIQYPIIARLGANQSANATAKSATGNWFQVQMPDRFGWLSGDFVTVNGDVARLPVAEAPALTRAPDARIIVPAGDIVNLRAAPNSRGRVLMFLRGRATAQVIGSNSNQTWWLVRYGNRTGWVNTGVVAEVGDFSNVPVTAP